MEVLCYVCFYVVSDCEEWNFEIIINVGLYVNYMLQRELCHSLQVYVCL